MGTLYIISTPIGNIDDITVRAIKTLFSVDIILCEDTRRSGLLLAELLRRFGEQFDMNPDWKPNLRPFYDEIEWKKTPEIIRELENGRSIGLISDAGTPLISDPGYTIVYECRKRNIPVVSIPGPSAFVAALTSAGIPTEAVLFLGYPPDKDTRMKKQLEALQTIRLDKSTQPTVVYYCAPHKLLRFLDAIGSVLGDRTVVLARELTKIHEEIWSGSVSDAKRVYAVPKGEFVLLLPPVKS